MESFFLASTFLLLGIIIGGICTAYFLYRFTGFTDEVVEEEQESHIPVEGIKIRIAGIPEEAKQQIQQEAISLKSFKQAITSKMKFHEARQEFEQAGMLKIMLENCTHWYDKRKNWFISKIGHKIIPDQVTCNCEGCQDIAQNGVFVENEIVAVQCFLAENYSNLEFKEFEYVDYGS